MRKYWIIIVMLMLVSLVSRSQSFLEGGTVRGNFQADLQTYQPDTLIGIDEDNDYVNRKAGFNAFGNFIYTNQGFTAGVRFETYLNPLNGFTPSASFEGTGIAHRFASYKKGSFEITLGNFYDQFGNGLIFRSYEEWNLGYDNAMDGVRVKFNPGKGILVKGIYGVQRKFWEPYDNGNRGIVRGVDGEIFLNDAISGLSDSKTMVIVGGSFVSKYQKADPFSPYFLPENVGAFAGRLNLARGGFNILGEYAYKINDPSSVNKNIFKDGQALFVSGSYSQKGIGVTLSAKYTDNMSFKSDRSYIGNALDINFLPPLTKTHTYSLEAMYPYATQPNGEFAYNAKVVFTLPKKSALGGKYGTTVELNYSRINDIKKQQINDSTPLYTGGTLGYESDFFSSGKLVFFQDINVEIHKKINKKWKVNAAYTNLVYNFHVIEDGILDDEDIYYAQIGTADITYKINRKNAIRGEFQYLATEQDLGDWAAVLFEYTIAPHWFFSLKDEYNVPSKDHYYGAVFGYTNGANKIQMSYGLQREGITCVGGICRQVPASKGFTITILSSF